MSEKIETPAFDELKVLLRSNQHDFERIVVVSDDLWARLKAETRDIFAPHGDDDRKVLWYQNRTMLMPQASVLNCVNSEVEPDGREKP